MLTIDEVHVVLAICAALQVAALDDPGRVILAISPKGVNYGSHLKRQIHLHNSSLEPLIKTPLMSGPPFTGDLALCMTFIPAKAAPSQICRTHVGQGKRVEAFASGKKHLV